MIMNSKNQSGFFIAGGLEFLVLAALVGGFAATDQMLENKAEQTEQTVQVEQVKAPVTSGFTRLDSNLLTDEQTNKVGKTEQIKAPVLPGKGFTET
jgi:hypothetical protein